MLENLLTCAIGLATPLSIGHAGTSVVSLQGVPWVTDEGHCGSKGCIRVVLLNIQDHIQGSSTTDGCKNVRISIKEQLSI